MHALSSGNCMLILKKETHKFLKKIINKYSCLFSLLIYCKGQEDNLSDEPKITVFIVNFPMFLENMKNI